MNKPLFSPLFFILLFSCFSCVRQEGKQDQFDLVMTEIRSDMDEIKHDLKTQQADIGVLEGKTNNLDRAVAAWRKEERALQESRKEWMKQLALLQQEISEENSKMMALTEQLKKLSFDYDELYSASKQHKETLLSIQQTLIQKEKQEKIAHITENREKFPAE